jgi:acetoin utilization deacetylase AcuC-like enzyme
MGFCLYDHVAVAAAHLRAVHRLRRILILDWDVHHGNGTQAIFWEDPAVLYISLHQFPYYPGTGAAHETGGGPGRGATLNIPVRAGADDSQWLAAFDDLAIPAARDFAPQFILISAGFDAHARDPLAQCRLSVAAYRHMTRELMTLAADTCQSRIVSVLEGGYDLEALAASVVVHLQELMR